MSGSDVADFERVIREGGVVLFPSDTVYGLACDPDNASAVERLYALKGRPVDKAAAVMFFDLHTALRALPELGERTAAALHALMPGALTALVPNPERRFGLAGRSDPETLGVRVVSVPALEGARVAVLQSSANPSGGADARSLDEVAPAIRAGADLAIDGGQLPGVPSTVVDLRRFESEGSWSIIRHGQISDAVIESVLSAEYHFEPETYVEHVIDEVHDYHEFQDALAEASAGREVDRILELGTGTGETARRLLAMHPRATLVGVDGSPVMLKAAKRSLPAGRFAPRLAMFEEPLPEGPFDLVASALAVHHLDDDAKAELFRRVRGVLAPGGRLVLADVVEPEDPADAVVEIDQGFDLPSPVAQQLEWMRAAGLEPRVVWQRQDLAVITADLA